jgi:peptide chain release factor 2
MNDIKEQISIERLRIKNIRDKLDIPSLEKRIEELEIKSSTEGFWEDSLNATKISKELTNTQSEVNKVLDLEEKITYVDELFLISKEEDYIEITKELEKIKKECDEMELSTYLSSKYDKAGAIFSIHAGQGGVEAMDWADMLFRMYTRYFNKKGWKYEITDILSGNEAGISSVSMEVNGIYAYGYLKRESGTHRLVRVSPFNAQGLRQTSFALVEVMPIIEDDDEIEIKSDDLEFQTTRSGGPGGQNVNKVNSKVIIKHIPSGIVVSAGSERTQVQNREYAMRKLKAQLFKIGEEKKQKEMSDLRGEHKVAMWGNQIRNYVLNPYKLVKDLRTKMETTNTDAVLGGDLDMFIFEEIKL